MNGCIYMKIKRILIIAAIFVLVVLSMFCVNRYQHTFSTTKWAAPPVERKKIVGDLLRNYELVGMSEDEIIDLLGKDDYEDAAPATFKIDRREFNPDDTLIYFIGSDIIDLMWLILPTEAGIVTEYLIDIT